MALSKFLVLIAIFLLAHNANALTSLSLVTENFFQVNHLILQLKQPMSKPKNPIANQPLDKSFIIKQEMKFNLHLLTIKIMGKWRMNMCSQTKNKTNNALSFGDCENV
jgi:hypothetical protein